ncbi:MAG: hypothetical protein R3F13_01780 [Prosthecobacter sp.]
MVLLTASCSLLVGGCKKTAAVKLKAEAPAPVIVKPTLLTEAPRLGLAERIAGDAEFCVTTVSLKKHAEALKASNWWRRTVSFLEEQVPAGDANAEPLVIDDTFAAFGKGSAAGVAMLRQLSELYNETAYRGLVHKDILAGPGTPLDAEGVLEVALRDAKLLEALILWLERFQMPPAMIGVASPQPEKVLARLSSLMRLGDWMGDAPQSRIVTPQGEQITVNEIAMAEIFTSERRREWLEALTKARPYITPDMKDRISRGLEVLARKEWVLALGLGPQRAYVAVGRTTDEVRLATSVEDSILSRPEMRPLDANAMKNLGLIACWDGTFLNALRSNEPFQPMVRGILTGLLADDGLGRIARSLTPLVIELAAAERAYYDADLTSGAAAVWWEDDLHAEWVGGASVQSTRAWSNPTRFSRLLDEESVILGVSGQGRGAGLGCDYFEAWMKLAHAAAGEWIRAGGGGENAPELFKVAEDSFLPSVLGIYDGAKTIWQKALGADGAFVLDVGGRMPALPGLPPGGQEVPLPRLLLANDLKNRALIGASWQNIETGLKQGLQMIPAPEPLKLPEALSRRYGDVETVFYETPLRSEELLPCVSLTETRFMIGTSRKQQTDAADVLRQPGMQDRTGMRVKMNFAKLREFLRAFTAVRSDVQGLKDAQKWLEPLEVFDLKIWSEGNLNRGVLSWTMHDVRSYD